MSDLCEKHRKGYEPLKLGILTPMCPLCLQAENKQLKLDLDLRDMLLEQIIKVIEGAAQALKETK